MADLPTLFTDGVLEATVRHGVARIKLGVQEGDGKPTPTGLLVMPLTQLPGLVGTLTRVMREVEAKAKEQQQAATAAGPAAESNDPPTTFRFS
ncbi:hypothetical protein [Roseomonas chloroacetimidivorans]|jgi:hypothetical protein|uniref:hypothetical protein n=1 Tax=Roseomonas chloroacetimidivorans TaxID=1766656 RepID=UPI003C742CC1